MGRLILLGTGDPLNGERAQSCLAVPLAGDEMMLWMPPAAPAAAPAKSRRDRPGELRHLFVTHRHFDHVGGLAPLLVALAAVPDCFPYRLRSPRDARLRARTPGPDYPRRRDWLGGRLLWNELDPHERPTRAGDAEVTPFEVDHGIECVGFRVAQGGSILVYAADTRPCPNVVRYARARTCSYTRPTAPSKTPSRPTPSATPPPLTLAGPPAPQEQNALYSPTCARAASPTPARW